MQEFQRYRLGKKLGQGAMGAVWLAEDAASGDQVALKVIAGEFAATPDARTQFKQEFRLMAQLRHPNCCAVYDYGLSPDGEPFFTMEVVPGKGLDELLPLAPERFEDVFGQLMLALGYVHQLGFVHRDLKPANVRVTPEGVVKLMDYGLMEPSGSAGGPVRGTLAYLAPEVLKRGPIDRRTDLYAAGALAYELLAGRTPFVGAKPLDVILGHLGQRPEPPSRLRKGVAPAHEALALKLLEKEPIARFQATGEVLAALGREAPSELGGSLLASPMVGREAALADLAGRLAAVARREPGAAIALRGPAGAGKTRLLEEFRFLAQLEEVPCAFVRAREGDLGPYGPVATLVRTLLPALHAAVPGALAAHGPVLARLVPEASDVAAPPLVGPREEQARLEAAVVDLLGALAAAAGLVVLLDGGEWLDPLSAQLLDRLAAGAGAAPLLVVTAGRGEAGEAGAFAPWTLGPLDGAAIARMAGSMLGEDALPPAFVSQMAALSAGNPAHLMRLLDHLVKQGQLAQRDGAWDTAAPIAADAAPHDLDGLLAARIAALAPDVRAVARAASVLRPGFDLALLDAVAGVGPDRTYDAVRDLAAQQLVVQDDDGAWALASGALRGMLAAGLEPAERARLHGAAAQALRARLGDRGPAEATTDEVTAIARHVVRAGEAEATVTYALEAGRRYAALFANAEATRYLEAGLTALRAQGDAGASDVRLAYLEALGDVRRVAGQAAAARDAYREALAPAREAGDPQRVGRLLASLARTLQALDALPEALACCDEAVATSLAAGDAGNAARALLTAARIRSFQGADVAAIADAERGVALAREAGRRAQKAEGLALLGYRLVATATARMAEGMADLAAAIAIYEELGERIGLAGAHTMLGDAQATRGEYAAARASFQRSRTHCEALGYRHELVFALLNLAIVDLAMGDAALAHAEATEAHALAVAVANRYATGVALVELARAEVARDPATDVAERLAGALAIAADLGHAYLAAHAHQAAAELAVAQGRAEDAAAALDALAAAGQPDADGRVALARAELAGLRGEPQAALAHAHQALATARAAGTRGVEARALAAGSRLAAAAGKADEARRLAAEAAALAQALGMGTLAAQAAKLAPPPAPPVEMPLGMRSGLLNL